MLGYVFGYSHDGGPGRDQFNNYNDIIGSYPELYDWYGFISGLAFTASFATIGIFGGLIADS